MKAIIHKFASPAAHLPKCLTGLQGLDAITGGRVATRTAHAGVRQGGRGKTLLAPRPMRRVIGDLTDTGRVLVGLDLRHAN